MFILLQFVKINFDFKAYVKQEIKKSSSSKGKYECIVCGEAFQRIPLLKAHYKVHGDGPFNCIICNKEFDDLLKCKRHYDKHSEVKEKKKSVDYDRNYKCFICGKEFTNRTKYAKHRKVHGKGPFNCKECDKELKNYQAVRTHMKAQHVEMVKCEVCNKEMLAKKLKDHMGYHTGEQRFLLFIILFHIPLNLIGQFKYY